MLRTAAALLAAAVGLAIPGLAGEFSKLRAVADNAPASADGSGVDGKTHQPGELGDVVVVVITCDSRPAALACADRILARGRGLKGETGR